MAATTREEALNQAIKLISDIMASPSGLPTLVSSATPIPAVCTGNVNTEQEIHSLFRRGTNSTVNPATNVASVASLNLNVTRETPQNMRYETRRTFGNWTTSTKKKKR